MTIYADTSALLKLVLAEPETAALREWLARADLPVVTSVVGRVELERVCRRLGGGAPGVAGRLLDTLVLLPLSPAVVERTAALPPDVLRSLDAVHVATALDLGQDLHAVVTYDRRMRDAAVAAGLLVRSPGCDRG